MTFLQAQTTSVAQLLCPECDQEEIKARVEKLEAEIEFAAAAKLGAEQRTTQVL